MLRHFSHLKLKKFDMFTQYKKYFITTIFSIFLTVFASSVYAQGWLFQNPYPTSQSLSGLKFVSPQKGWIIGMEGTILYTEDAGNTWDIQESGTNQYLTSIFFINEKTGWIVGTGGTILYTEDGGKKWVSQDSGSDHYTLHKVFFIDSKEGWIVGNDTTKDEGIILHIEDGGKKWDKLLLPERKLNIASIFFWDNKTGWFLAGNKVFRTADGGKNWEPSDLPVQMPSIFSRGMPKIGHGWHGDIFFTDVKNGWVVVGLWYIFSTDDGGKTWKTQFSGENMSYGLGHFFFTSNKKGCVGGSTIFCTENGLNWKERLGVKPMQRQEWKKSFLIELWAGDFINNDTAWAVGPYGLIMKTEDGGKKWEVKTRNIIGFKFINNKVGWGDEEGKILYTDDGGDTWKVQVEMKDLITLRRFFVFNQLEGLAIGYMKPKNRDESIYRVRILHTSDGGKTWITQVNESIIPSIEPGGDFYFINSNNGWFIGAKGIIFYTGDGGKNWKRQKSGTELHLHGVHFVDAPKGWVIGDSGVRGYIEEDDPQPEGVILHTEDGGQNWHIQWTKKGIWLNGLFFVDSNRGYVTGENGLLLYTEDGGKTWVEKKVAEENLGTPFFIDAIHGWIPLSEERGTETVEKGLLVIEDGGKTWVKKKIELHKYPWRPFMENEKTPQK